MSDTVEIKFEDLELSKPLDKMTAKELRQLVIDKLPMIVGASGMTKDELLTEIKGVFGIAEEGPGASPYKERIQKLKREMKGLREEKKELSSRKDRKVMRKRINRLKKQTRQLARVEG